LAVRVGQWYEVRWLIDYFVAHGCRYAELPSVVETPYGLRTIRYILNPAGTQFVTLSDLADDEQIPETIYGSWALLLGVDLPKNGLAC
jgi:hypothetical protein